MENLRAVSGGNPDELMRLETVKVPPPLRRFVVDTDNAREVKKSGNALWHGIPKWGIVEDNLAIRKWCICDECSESQIDDDDDYSPSFSFQDCATFHAVFHRSE